MTAAGTDPEAWQEKCLISIIPHGTTAISCEGITEDITGMEWGEKDIEGQVLINGGRVAKYTSMTDESITLKVYPVNAEVGANEGVVQHFHQILAGDDATQPIVVANSQERRKFGIVILWAETLPANAVTVPVTSKTAYRIQVVNAYLTSYKPNFDDKIFSAEVTFKWTPFQKGAGANKREESTDGTVALAAAITVATSF